MSKLTKEINKISLAVIGISGRLVFYALVLVLLVMGVRRAYEFGHDIFYAPGMEALPGTEKTVTLGRYRVGGGRGKAPGGCRSDPGPCGLFHPGKMLRL